MKNRKLTLTLICLAGLLGILFVSVLVYRGSDSEVPENNGKRQETAVKGKLSGRKAKARARLRKGERPGKLGAGVETEDVSNEKQKPTFALDDDDEANLNEEQRKTIMAIRAALDNNDRKTVLRLVQKLQKSDEWPDGIPKSVKMAAIEALGWFGSSCLPELAGFLGDSDQEVIQAAIDKYQEMLADFELSDTERSEILVQASKVIDDADAIDSMMFELNNMRHSIAVETIKRLMADGNAATKSILPNNVEFYTGEEGVDSPEKLDDWLKRNPDDEGDIEFYAGSKSSSK